MLHFVLKDVNPAKVGSFKQFLKEMNDLSVLLTVAEGPHLAEQYLQDNSDGGYSFLKEEGGYESRFDGQKSGEQVRSGLFKMSKKGEKIVEVSFTIVEGKASDVRVWINAEGEGLAKKELEKTFQRDFSQEAHGFMKESLESLTKPKLTIDSPEVEALLSETDEQVEENIMEEVQAPIEENEEGVEPSDNVIDELDQLTEKTMQLINDSKTLLATFNHLSHDLTRGGTVDFGTAELKFETLENGATVEMLDDNSSDYTVTLRIGKLEDLKEISFFLENKDGLVFSVYLSSSGKGNITAPEGQEHIVFKKARACFL